MKEITAVSARKISEESKSTDYHSLMDKCYFDIRNSAECGGTDVFINVGAYNHKTIREVVKELKKKGFKSKHNKLLEVIKIEW